MVEKVTHEIISRMQVRLMDMWMVDVSVGSGGAKCNVVVELQCTGAIGSRSCEALYGHPIGRP